MDTFIDLYEFLQSYEGTDIIGWLADSWVGKDKQESLLRIFAGLGLIEKLNAYDMCKGNFNTKTIQKNSTIKDVFYNEDNTAIHLKDKGDSSDLTGISKTNEKHILVTTSKSLKKDQVGKLDIEKLSYHFDEYPDFLISLCICIKDESEFKRMMNRIERTNEKLKKHIEREDTIIIEWNDLNQAYSQFKLFYGQTPLERILDSAKSTLCLKMHQRLGVWKTVEMKRNGKQRILWGHIQRSGKSYIIGGCIIEDSKDKQECNYLIMTTAPNETIEQQRKVLDCTQLNDFNIIVLNGKKKKPVLTKKNIIICSKQFLQTKLDKSNEETIKSIAWLKKLFFDMRFVDESHNGGTTELAKKTLDFYGKLSFTIQITATYSKPINDYNIQKDCWILWDLEDIQLCKHITETASMNRLIEKHGECIREILSTYSTNSIIREYSTYPELWILTDEIRPDIANELRKDTRDNHYGWSPDACFLLKQSVQKDRESQIVFKEEFQNEVETLKVWYRIFGKKNPFGIPDKEYPDDIVFMKRIEKICKDPTIDSRFIGEGDLQTEPMIIMTFLPQHNIDIISKATITLLEKHKVLYSMKYCKIQGKNILQPDYEIVSINSKTTNNPKQCIEDARIKARMSGKKGVLVLSGKQCSLGVSIDNCDIVLLLNNSMGFDMIYQMMFRCMTEGTHKKCGFVVDLNIHRVIETSVIHYASFIKPDLHPKEATKFILQERLINLNGDHWMPSFGNDVSRITALCEKVYDIYSSNTENALNHLLTRIRFKDILLSREEQTLFNAMFSNTTPTKIQRELLDKLTIDDDEEKIKKGIEKTRVDTSSKTSHAEDEKEGQQIHYTEILKHIIPLICLLTIHEKETSFIEMFKFIETNEYVYNILIDQTKSWWGKSIDAIILKKFTQIYMKYMMDDKETTQIIRTVKEIFVKNIKNNRELSKLIDTYLIPQELEKKSNAEVSTPFKLREEMLDKMPSEFWKSPTHMVFEPCAGKGGFLIDIIDRFMIGLKEAIPDEKLRYKTIVEKCLYFSDINPTNIFICKLLIDPYNEYKLNYHEGNTLELDIKDKWGITEFDAVIGNPPYQKSTHNKGTGNTLWNVFVEQSLNNWLKQKGYLLFVHPKGWRQIHSKLGCLIKQRQLHYLNMNDVCKGIQTFKCSTDYDYYLLENTPVYKQTIINDYKGDSYEYFFNENTPFIPNHSIQQVMSIMTDTESENGFINDQSSYEVRKKWMSSQPSDEFKYPCVYSINAKNEISFKWSSRNDKGHFGITKFIFSNGNGFVKDYKGEYGLTQWAYGIVCSVSDMDTLECVFSTELFRNIVDAIRLTSNKYNYKILKYFKKDFWKDFV